MSFLTAAGGERRLPCSPRCWSALTRALQVKEPMAEEALRLHNGDLTAAQVWIFQQRASGGGPLRGSASAGAKKIKTQAELEAEQDALDEDIFQRDLAKAQADSAAAEEQQKEAERRVCRKGHQPS